MKIKNSKIKSYPFRKLLKIVENLVNIWGRKDERGARDQDRSFIGLWKVSFSPLSCDLIRRACVQASAV